MSERPPFTNDPQLTETLETNREPSPLVRELTKPIKGTVEMLKKLGSAAFRIGTTSNKGEYGNLRARIIIKPMSTTPASITELKVAYRKKQEKEIKSRYPEKGIKRSA